ncbi:FAD-dependent monooxygenase [Methylocystis bryophila]|uniref:Salicylate 1-monooxygenase n=1 Tax=Methylocystis bryophila TaxID=655015 RepID=A0A1W6MW28_9HYPH|nr:FAD-dependent monooxygenase [Methylocystis bryophila]ARN81699.1 salicylate 1-monooxygenase [Methylocystis bryophila]BDV37748.1 salicylate hydroxylase [Methylocystis bryophila]
MSPSASDAVVVAGAGIGGLAAALCLARAGKRVALFEKAPKIEEVGAGLQIAPNAGRILQGLGLSAALDANSLLPESIIIRRATDGAELSRMPLAGARERFGAPFRLFHRADLQNLLLDAARASEKIAIRTDARVGDFEEEDGKLFLRVHGSAGPEDIEAAGLIGADGVRSSVRAFLFRDERDAPFYSGCTAWRALLPAETVPTALRAKEVNLWLGRGAHVVHYPLRGGEIVNAVVIVEDGEVEPASNEPMRDGPSLLEAADFERCAPQLRDLIASHDSWRRWPLWIRPALRSWTRGAVTLLGDAAHPMVPFLAQGAAQAIEDAEALGQAFAGGASAAAAFARYEGARLSRATAVQTASRRQGRFAHAGFPLAQARDAVMSLIGGRGMLERNAWLYR